MQIDDPQILIEVGALFDRYERALVSNDVAELDQLFWDDERTLRYGATENLVGYQAIREFRASRSGKGLERQILSRHVTVLGRDAAVTAITFSRAGQSRIGRQTQCWARMPQGWRIVAAHVSWM